MRSKNIHAYRTCPWYPGLMGVCGCARLCHTGVGVGVPWPRHGIDAPEPHRADTSEGPTLNLGGSERMGVEKMDLNYWFT